MKILVNSLIKWYLKNKRDLPWRQTQDPYKIWLSEVILQQTRVEQGLPYYNKFIQQYPDILSLANASDDDVMKLWQGLGYYSRARNMLFSARFVRDELDGRFPNTIIAIKQLKGVGDYTAAAIGSFAFKIKEPVLDGNVYRFFTRLYGIETPIDQPETKQTILSILREWISHVKDPGVFNQAIMEFGALQCTSDNPKCESCPFVQECYAYKSNKTKLLPIKSKKVKVKNRYFNYVFFNAPHDLTYMEKRGAGDIWQDLYQFPLIETEQPVEYGELARNKVFRNWTKGVKTSNNIAPYTVMHKLTHQNLYVKFFIVDISKFLKLENSSIFEIEKNTIISFAVPRVIEKFLHNIIFKLY